jgi:hypothetical protein
MATRLAVAHSRPGEPNRLTCYSRAHARHPQRADHAAGDCRTQLAGSAFAIGVLTPRGRSVLLQRRTRLRFGSIVIGIVFWFGASAVLHMFGRTVLGSLRQ